MYSIKTAFTLKYSRSIAILLDSKLEIAHLGIYLNMVQQYFTPKTNLGIATS